MNSYANSSQEKILNILNKMDIFSLAPRFLSIDKEYGSKLQSALAYNIQIALDEDIGSGDVTGSLFQDEERCACVIAREDAVLSGALWFQTAMACVDSRISIDWYFSDGQYIYANTVICRMRGPTRSLLIAERSALNFLQLLSGVASTTKRYVDMIRTTENRSVCILDTRKTIPGLRLAQKYSVRIGGGENQRIALYDGVLLKENHIAAAGGIAAALERARSLEQYHVQIEVENLNQLEEALRYGAFSILLDNFSITEMREAVLRNAGRALLEVSGNIDIKKVADVARTGIHRISIGALTKNIHAIDFSMKIT